MTELYTPEQLSEIEELRDRVEYLESLCDDYAKILVEKDKELFRLAMGTPNEFCVGITPEFKAISDMSIRDWEKALDESWEFKSCRGENIKVICLDVNHEYPVRVMSEFSTRWLTVYGVDLTSEADWSIISRIK